MSKSMRWVVVLGVLAIIVLWGMNVYNGLAEGQEDIESACSQVENQYQRRADMIPNLVTFVKGYAKHDQESLEGVIAARAKATQISIHPEELTQEQMAAFQAAQGELSQALNRLFAVAERYPEMKANANFRDLHIQLEVAENRIAVARQYFNETAKAYNKLVRRFPSNIIAAMFGYEKTPYFEAESAVKKDPKMEI